MVLRVINLKLELNAATARHVLLLLAIQGMLSQMA